MGKAGKIHGGAQRGVLYFSIIRTEAVKKQNSCNNERKYTYE